MPQVPSVNNISTSVSGGPTTTFINAQDQSGAVAAKQTADLGNAVQSAGRDFTAVEIDIAEQANQLRISDGMNSAKELALKLAHDKDTGYLSLMGKNALSRPDGQSLADEYTSKLNQGIADIEASLGNDAQRRAFRMNAEALSTQFYGQVTQHEGAQFKEYSASVRKGTIQNRQNEIALNYNNPEVVGEAVKSIHAASYDLAVTQLGKSGQEAEAFARDSVSNAHKIAILTALQNGNVTYANGYFAKYSKDGQMNGDDILAVNGQLNTQMDATLASGAVAKATQTHMSGFQPTDMDRLNNIVLGQESNGKDFAPDGSVLTSSKGAKGRQQVMDATNRDPGYGVTPAKDDSLEERARVGRDYLKAMVGRYGDVTKALAAYNGGPQRVDDAVAKAKAEGNEANWINYMPKESQDYALNGTKKFNAGTGATHMPTEYEYVQTALANVPAGSRTETIKATREAAIAQYTILTESVKQKEDQAVADGIREMQMNGGNFALLSPAVRAAIPPDKVDKVREAGINKITNPVLYSQLSNDPSKYMNMTDDQFLALRSELSETDWKHFADQRAGAGSKGPGVIGYGPLNIVLNQRLQSAGIDPTPRDGSSDAQQVAAIRQSITGLILAEQQVKGRQLTDQETNQVVDRAFALKTPARWFQSTPHPAVTQGVNGIPSATKDAIVKAFEKNGRPNPSDADILNAYLRGLYFTQQNTPQKKA